MTIWLIVQIINIVSMPAAYRMARQRGRSAWAWLDVAFFMGPLALLALLVLGKRDSDAVSG